MNASRQAPHELVERALAASTADDCVVLVEEASSTNLRWANNTLTTNGVSERLMSANLSVHQKQG